jgi:hypothetical protein
MIGDYIVVAFVLVLGLSFVSAIHYFWLRGASREETPPLDGPREIERGYEFSSALNEPSLKVDCQNPQFAFQTSSRSEEITANASPPGSNVSPSSITRTKLWTTISI